MALRISRQHVSRILSNGPAPVVLQIPKPLRQERDNWCWAACCQMAMFYRKVGGERQCDIAATYLSDPACPGCCCPDACNQPCSFDDVKNMFYKNGLTSAIFISGYLSPDDLQHEIRSGNLVALGLKGASNHMILVTGFTDNLFTIQDPAPDAGSGTASYAELLDSSREGGRKWVYTWKGI